MKKLTQQEAQAFGKVGVLFGGRSAERDVSIMDDGAAGAGSIDGTFLGHRGVTASPPTSPRTSTRNFPA